MHGAYRLTLLRKLLPLTVVTLALCQEPGSSQKGEPQATAYLEQALSLIQEKYVYRDSIEWSAIQDEALAQAAGAEEPVDTYEAIRLVLRRLGDRHCRLELTKELADRESLRRAERHLPPVKPEAKVISPFRERTQVEGELITEKSRKYGFLVVPMFTRGDPTNFATAIQSEIGKLLAQRPCGWIVDLRGNRGGNMWPMLAGIGPVLGQGVVGEFLDRSGDVFSKWLYKNGRAWSGFNEDVPIGGAVVAGQPVVMADQHFPVAILIDQATGSAGEAVAIAFKGRPRTRFFGTNTAGATSSAESFVLSDGAVVMLPGVAMADRNGRSYKGGIAPDQQIAYKRLQFGKDSVVEAAFRWLFVETGHGTAKEEMNVSTF